MDSEMEVGSKKFTYKNRCRELAMSSSFCRRIYTEVEEVGWEHLVKLGDDLTFIRFRIMDNKRRAHILEITLDKTYPRSPPSLSADVPYNSHPEWSSNSRLRDVVQQFKRHVDKLQDFWLTLDGIDRSFCVIDPMHSHLAVSYRQIKIGNDCCIVLSINVDDPRSLPECRFLGSDTEVNILRDIWKQNCKKWTREKSCPENLLHIFGNQLPQPSHLQKSEEQVECGICYAQYLPTDDELGAKSGTATDYSCENGSCNRAFHSVCLGDWLCSITTTRQSFDVLFGNCPYCSDPVAVKLGMKK
ncbi:E3 ubiquitin-protein ligase FANCL-like isoform X1 [Salvia splendens]|uniref:E3 ubiquitin-protein ligase FANCL-like isoform X1 n=1 Tax=Salvia splendens TaxID=180675 RepID=UPI001C27B7E0|nr:E3 ubiquitin-protein ligase FANCL-like isoform X1 [Salvia splendens]